MVSRGKKRGKSEDNLVLVETRNISRNLYNNQGWDMSKDK